MNDTILADADGRPSANRAVVHAPPHHPLEQAEKYSAKLHGIFVVDTDLHGDPALRGSGVGTVKAEDFGQELLDECDVEK